MIISARNISFCADGVVILQPMDLTLLSGRTHVLLGPNGAGKSTLLRVLSGSVATSSGTIHFDDDPLTELSLVDRARRLGVLTQRSDLDFPFTAREVVNMGRTPFGVQQESAYADDMISALGIKPAQRYTTLSGGEKQLVQLARVLTQVAGLGSGGFLFLDEPLTALDLRHQSLVAGMLATLKGEGLGQLVVLHDINMAATIADEVILMKQGQVIAAGAPREILEPVSLEQTFDTKLNVVSDGDSRFYKPDMTWQKKEKS